MNITEGKHKAGCQCGFCKNKGRFGKKADKGDAAKVVEQLLEGQRPYWVPRYYVENPHGKWVHPNRKFEPPQPEDPTQAYRGGVHTVHPDYRPGGKFDAYARRDRAEAYLAKRAQRPKQPPRGLAVPPLPTGPGYDVGL